MAERYPEMGLLLAAARRRYGSSDADRVAAVAARVTDWDLVLRLAQRHAITPLLWAAAKDLDIPDEPRRELETRDAANRLRNLELSQELLRIIERLAVAGIDSMPYKGPVLAAAIYGDVGLREFVDLDVLVRPRDVRGTTALLEEDGYRPVRAYSPHQRRYLFETGHDWKLQHPDGPVVEIQWAVADASHPFARNLSALFARRVQERLGGRAVRTLSREDLLLVLCEHGSIHLWERLAWVCDVAELLRTMDAAAVEEAERRARAAAGHRPFLVGLAMARRLLGIGPGTRDGAVLRVARRIEPSLRGDAEPEAEVRGGAHLALRISMGDRWSDRAREMARLLFRPSPSDWISVPLPDALWLAYYPIHVGRLAWWYGVRRRSPGIDVD